MAQAQFNLGCAYANGEGVGKDLVEAVKWYRKAAEQGDVDAQFILGNAYFKGEGVAKYLVEGVKWWRKAAEHGNASSQFNLALAYYNGKGVAKDLVESVKWMRKAAVVVSAVDGSRGELRGLLGPEAAQLRIGLRSGGQGGDYDLY